MNSLSGPGGPRSKDERTWRSALQQERTSGRVVLFLRIVRIDDVAGLVLGRPQDDFGLGIAELVDVVAFDALELHRHHLGRLPLAFGVELDVADNGLESIPVR